MSAPALAKVSDELMAQSTLSAAATAIYEIHNSFSDLDQLDEVGKLLWKGYGEGKISADALCTARRCGIPSRSPGVPPPDRKASRDRRRMLGGSSALPHNLRHHYTEGQRSVLCIVAGEVKRHGICDFPIDKIAALAGVCRTTVQTALHAARRLGHITITERPQPSRKNLPNVVEIISPEWRTWIRRGPAAARFIGSNSPKMVSPTKKTDLNKREDEEEKRARWSPSANLRPPNPLARRAIA